jgi:hypothetical protein
VLIERRFGQIPVHRAEVFETEFVGAEGGVTQTSFFHGNSSSRLPGRIGKPELHETNGLLDRPPGVALRTCTVAGLLVANMTPAKTKACRSPRGGTSLMHVNAKLSDLTLPTVRFCAAVQQARRLMALLR